jgi:carboxypeptidase T
MTRLNMVVLAIFPAVNFAVSLGVSLAAATTAEAAWQMSPNSEHVRGFIQDLAKKYPSHTQIFELGRSDTGRVIPGISIGNGPVKQLVVAAHHGNEYGSTEVAKALAQSLAEQPLQGLTVHVVPVLNLDGFDRRQRWENGRDPNRDYPGPCGTSGPFRLKSTKALADFTQKEQIVTALTFHTFTPVVAYPWGISTKDTHTIQHMLFEDMAQQAVIESRYPTGTSTDTIYPADGTFEDYAYWQFGAWAFLFELGRSHSPTQAAVEEMIRVNVPGVRRLLASAPRERAAEHEFTGRCDARLKALDRQDE